MATRSGWRPWLHEEGTRTVDAALLLAERAVPTTGCSPWTRG
ncbi:hypothetical protein [Streptomyces echinatus]